MHALVIEDQFLIAALIEDVLRDLGYTSFDVVDREDDAVEAARRRCPDLITADQKLTDGTGVKAVQTICAERPIPFIFITEHGSEVTRLLPGAVVVGKPFSATALGEAVGRATGLIHGADAAE